jgi:phage host-nuclease inhibitor protein Gam
MKKPRSKITITPPPATRDEAESILNDYAATVNSRRILTARRDSALLRIEENFRAEIAACDNAIESATSKLKAWAEANPSQFPKDRKSLKMFAGTIGFRTGTPKLSLVSRAWSWEKVLDAIKNTTCYKQWIRLDEQVKKEAILAEHAQNKIVPQDLQSVGLKIVQDESFFVDPDLTPFDPVAKRPVVRNS